MTDFPRSVADSAPAVATVVRTSVKTRPVADSAPATDIAPPAGPPGNVFATPIAISGTSGSTTVSLIAASLETGELAAPSGTVWLRLTAGSGPGELTVSSSTSGAHVEVIDGTEMGDLAVVVADGTGIVPTGPYYLRVYGTTGHANVTWSFVPRVAPLVLQLVDNEIDVTPGSLIATVTNVAPNVAIHFDVEIYDAITEALVSTVTDVLVTEADTTGSLVNVTVAIDGLDAGSYMLVARTATQAERQGFTVLVDQDERPDAPPVITYPPYTPPVLDVQRWIVLNPVDNSVHFTFPINPSEKTTPHAPKNFSTRHTTAPDGQHITWEGAIRALEWTVTGYIETQAFYEALEALLLTNRRWWVVDNRKRMWLVSFEGFEPEQHRRNDDKNNWSYDYKLVMYIYAGPEQY